MADADATAALAAAGDGANGTGTQEPNQSQSESTQTGDSQTGDSWITTLPEHLQKRAESAKWASPAAAVQSYVDLEKYASKSVQDMSPEERAKYLKRLGDRPESPDGYELSNVQLPDGVGYTDAESSAFRQKMHELGITKQQARDIDEWAKNNALNLIKNAQRLQAKKFEEYETTMRGEWGSDYDSNENGVLELGKKFGDDEVVKFLKGPGRHPAMRKFLQRIRETMLEDTLEDGGPVSERGRQTGLFNWEGVKGAELLRDAVGTKR